MKVVPASVAIEQIADLAEYTLKLEQDNIKLEKQNKVFKKALAKLARKLENDKVKRN